MTILDFLFFIPSPIGFGLAAFVATHFRYATSVKRYGKSRIAMGKVHAADVTTLVNAVNVNAQTVNLGGCCSQSESGSFKNGRCRVSVDQ